MASGTINTQIKRNVAIAEDSEASSLKKESLPSSCGSAALEHVICSLLCHRAGSWTDLSRVGERAATKLRPNSVETRGEATSMSLTPRWGSMCALTTKRTRAHRSSCCSNRPARTPLGDRLAAQLVSKEGPYRHFGQKCFRGGGSSSPIFLR